MNLKNHNILGIIAAIIYSLFVVVILLLLGFTTPLPLPQEEAILIDFGGGGNIDAGASSSATSNDNTSTQNSSISGVNTQSFEDAASMSTGNNPDNTTTPTAPTNPNANKINNLFGGGVFNNGSGSGNSGSGSGSGNPGTGVGGDGSGSGTGPGGVGGNVGTRKVVKRVDPVGKDNMVGKVVLKFVVNDKGQVSSITVVSTNCNECVQPAKDAVKQWLYEAKPGTGDQVGTVTIEFKQS